ncbi:hypothetical protein Bbelb_207130 [Branchiostoma belcheri]|nr:hypothetical protein Bbelb_207130 [Branchiostoma belcheri]
MEPQIGEVGQGDDQRTTSLWALLERPCGFGLTRGPVESVETEQKNASRLPTRFSHGRRVSVARKVNATLRAATETIVVRRADRNGQDGETVVNLTVSETRTVPPNTRRSRRRDQSTGPEKNTPQTRLKSVNRRDADAEHQSRSQQRTNRAREKKSDNIKSCSRIPVPLRRRRAQSSLDCPPPGTYCDPHLSKTALIYHDVIAGERVLINYLPDDICKWESTDDVELSACQKGVTPSDYTDDNNRIIPRYRRHMDKVYRKELRQVAHKLRKYVRDNG